MTIRLAAAIPTLVDSSRSRLTRQLPLAQMIGRFAVGAARKRAASALSGAAEPLARLGREPHGKGLLGPVETPSPGGARTRSSAPGASFARSSAGQPDALGDEATGIASGGLAIPGYDSLAASQVVLRLAGLLPEELAAVRRYELATRRRRTVLGRIAQLEAKNDTGQQS